MANNVNITVSGIPEIIRALQALNPAVEAESRVQLTRAGAEMASRMKAIVPIRTRKLRDSITPGPIFGAGANMRLGVGPWGVRYATFVEYGTSKMAARPYMRPAYAANAERIKTQMVQGILRVVNIHAGP